jgi:hypothetical protein
MKDAADGMHRRTRSGHGMLLTLIALTSLCLNLAGNSWSTPDRWR